MYLYSLDKDTEEEIKTVNERNALKRYKEFRTLRWKIIDYETTNTAWKSSIVVSPLFVAAGIYFYDSNPVLGTISTIVGILLVPNILYWHPRSKSKKEMLMQQMEVNTDEDFEKACDYVTKKYPEYHKMVNEDLQYSNPRIISK